MGHSRTTLQDHARAPRLSAAAPPLLIANSPLFHLDHVNSPKDTLAIHISLCGHLILDAQSFLSALLCNSGEIDILSGNACLKADSPSLQHLGTSNPGDFFSLNLIFCSPMGPEFCWLPYHRLCQSAELHSLKSQLTVGVLSLWLLYLISVCPTGL